MDNIWCIIIPIITAILGWLLRHLTCKKCNYDDLNYKIKTIENTNSKLKGDLDACLSGKKHDHDLDLIRAQNNKLKADLEACLASKKLHESAGNASNINAFNTSTTLETTEPKLIFDADKAKAVFGKKVVADDLKLVEGIGPKISQLFNNNGISTWYQLSIASIERCQEVLNSGGKRYEIHNPSTWPKQSGLAFNGKWEELKELQDYLDGGIERG